MQKYVRSYNELTKDQLFAIYQVRNAVLIVHQNIVFPDIDDLDKICLHTWFEEDGKIIAYCRIVPPGIKYAEPSFGRVLVIPEKRRHGLGTELTKAAIEAIEEHYHSETIRIEAMSYIQDMYAKVGFKAEGEEFLESDVPHVTMIWHA